MQLVVSQEIEIRYELTWTWLGYCFDWLMNEETDESVSSRTNVISW